MAAKLLLVALALISLALAGCSNGSADAEFGIHDSAFDPRTLTVKAGTVVHFENHDTITHTATSDVAGAFSTGNIAAGGDGHVTVNTPGTYPFHCAIHPSMKGTLTVT